MWARSVPENKHPPERVAAVRHFVSEVLQSTGKEQWLRQVLLVSQAAHLQAGIAVLAPSIDGTPDKTVEGQFAACLNVCQSMKFWEFRGLVAEELICRKVYRHSEYSCIQHATFEDDGGRRVCGEQNLDILALPLDVLPTGGRTSLDGSPSVGIECKVQSLWWLKSKKDSGKKLQFMANSHTRLPQVSLALVSLVPGEMVKVRDRLERRHLDYIQAWSVDEVENQVGACLKP